jgi:hypothetical protein
MGELALRRLMPQAPPDMFVADPLVGFRLAPNYRGAQVTKTASIPLEFNSWGLRDREYGRRPDGGSRIYVVGDSFVFGDRVRIEETFTKVLERSLRRRLPGRDVEVVNGGVPRYGTLQQVEFFEQTVEMVNPDIVLLGMFVANDVLDNLAFEQASAGRRTEGRAAGALGWLRVRSQLYLWARRRHHAAQQRQQGLQRRAMETHAVALSPEMERGLTLTEDAVDALARLARGHGARFAMVLIPSAAQVYPALWQQALARDGLPASGYDPRQPNLRLDAFAREEQIAALDLLPNLQARAEEKLYFTLHWNARGHAVAAEATAAFLLESGLLGTPAPLSARAQ